MVLLQLVCSYRGRFVRHDWWSARDASSRLVFQDTAYRVRYCNALVLMVNDVLSSIFAR